MQIPVGQIFTVGQIFKDKDRRMGGRHVKVGYLYYGGRYADCVDCRPNGEEYSQRARRIALKTLRERFQLVEPQKEQ